jgi:phospholipase C
MQQEADRSGSFRQRIRGIDGTYGFITPFLIPRAIHDRAGRTVMLYPEDTFSVDHSHLGMAASMHFDAATRSLSKNDGYVLDQEKLRYAGDASDEASVVSLGGAAPGGAPSLKEVQEAELMLAHLDCDTIPFLWQYADRFALFDNFHQTTIGPSTPNAIAMIAGQTGETQWALHPEATGRHLGNGQEVPNTYDSAPFAGSAIDTVAGPKPPYGPDEQDFSGASHEKALPPADGKLSVRTLKGAPGKFNAAPKSKAQVPLTFASLPLSFMGPDLDAITARDEAPAIDLADVQGDMAVIASRNPAVPWGWYQQGYGPEPFDGRATIALDPASTAHPSYIVHHNGPQYFGYLGDNPAEQARMHSLSAFYADVARGALPAQGGVFYVRGGYYNNDDLRTLDPNPDVRAVFPGNDDHPGYSDAQISEAMVADSVNAIAASKYWPQSAIILTYDETDGLYDHVPERVRSWGPDGFPLTGGPRIPAILISPFAAAHVVSHVYSEHNSVIKFIDRLFGLVPLADLPDEVRGRRAGAANASLAAPGGARQRDLGPADDLVPMGDLSEAFDADRLRGTAPVLSAAYATITGVRRLPHAGGAGCKSLGIVPTDYPHGLAEGAEIDPPPSDFNPRPVLSPGIPADGGWSP